MHIVPKCSVSDVVRTRTTSHQILREKQRVFCKVRVHVDPDHDGCATSLHKGLWLRLLADVARKTNITCSQRGSGRRRDLQNVPVFFREEHGNTSRNQSRPKNKGVEHRERAAVAVLHCWTKSPHPTFSQCATNASCSWSCRRQNHKHMICVRRVGFDVHVAGWWMLLTCSPWFFFECLAFCSVGRYFVAR